MNHSIIAIFSMALAGCATLWGDDRAFSQRANQSMKKPPLLETETSAQQAAKEGHEKAFGQKLEMLSKKDAFEPPRLHKYVRPVYPLGAKRNRLSGSVAVGVVIGVDGSVSKAKIISSTDPIFESAALDAVRQWTFTPAKKNEETIEIAYTVPVEFRL